MDPLETRLREALRDDRWRLPVDNDALDRVHLGAARRRRRRATLTVAAAALVLAGAGAAGIGYVVRGPGLSVVAGDSSGGQSAAKSAPKAPDAAGGLAERQDAKPPHRSPTPTNEDGKSGELAGTKAAIAEPVPAGFSPVSLTAINRRTFWLLGDAKATRSATVAVTRDSGASFSTLSRLGAKVARGSNETTTTTVRDLRFAGDGQNAWAFGGALWTSHDAGATWSRTRTLPGAVEQLETAGGSTYALVHGGTSGWTLWRTPADHDDWQQVGDSTFAPGSLTVTTSAVVLTERDEDHTFALVSEDDGTTFSERKTPCSPDLDAGRLSGTVGAVWLTCSTGTAASVYVSTDAATTWTKVPTGPPAISETGSALAARSASKAVVAVQGEALIVSSTGTTRTPVPGLGSPAYTGFTTDSVGYILDLSGQLFRTTNGGAGWARLVIR